MLCGQIGNEPIIGSTKVLVSVRRSTVPTGIASASIGKSEINSHQSGKSPRLGTYNATYGSLGAAIGMIIWLRRSLLCWSKPNSIPRSNPRETQRPARRLRSTCGHQWPYRRRSAGLGTAGRPKRWDYGLRPLPMEPCSGRGVIAMRRFPGSKFRLQR
jgi:hypothetical protein